MSSTPAARAGLAARPSRVSTGRLGPPRDYGRLLARGLCVLFALIGLLPVMVTLAARSTPLRAWAATETSRLLEQLTGLEASYQVRLDTWPLGLTVTDLVVLASDGGSPALISPRLTITPRVFSLLAGRVDAGHIAIEEPTIRLVLKDGKLQNLALTLPDGSSGDDRMRTPFSSLAITDAHFVGELEGVAIDSSPIDLDVFAESGSALEIALRAAATSVVQRRALPGGATALDEDVFCQVDARVRVQDDYLLVHRLSLVGAIDERPEPGSARSCDAEMLKSAPLRVLARVSGLSLSQLGGKVMHAGGHVLFQAPLELANRYLPALELDGWVALNGDVQYHAGDRLPEFHGKVRSGRVQLKKYLIVDGMEADVHLVSNQVVVPALSAGYADGSVQLEGITLDLRDPTLPLTLKKARANELSFPGLMRDVDVTPNTIINWDLSQVTIDDFNGTLSPVHLRGRLKAETQDFEVFDRAVHDPARKHMIGVRRADVRGYFGIEPDSVRFTEIVALFGQSKLMTDVHIGFDNTIWLKVPKGSQIDLVDVSPLVDIPMAGRAAIDVDMSGKMSDALLLGNLSVDGLVFSGFPLGDIASAKLRFKPLKVEVTDVVAKKGQSPYNLSQASLDFDGPATILADASVTTPSMDVRDFFAMWHFDEDPRWDDVFGKGAISARIRYALGGPLDRCDTGDLRVRGEAAFQDLSLFDERYHKASSSFDFHWSDIAASYLGMSFDLPNLELTKGSGTLLGSARIAQNGKVNAQLVLSQVPLAAIQGLGTLAQSAVGSASGTAQFGGTLDALSARADVRVSAVRIGRAHLPASRLNVVLRPIERGTKSAGTTACGAQRPTPFDPNSLQSDQASGVFHVNGELFGGQIRVDDLRVSRQRDKRVQGSIGFAGLDLVALGNLSPRVALLDPQPKSTLSAQLTIEDLPLNNPARARGKLALQSFLLEYRGAKLASSAPTELALGAGQLDIPRTTLRATAQGGHQGSFDLSGRVLDLGGTPELDLSMRLLPIELSGLAGLVPNADHLEGQFRGQLAVTGSLAAPEYHGGFELTDGALQFRSSAYALSELDVKLGVRPGELVIEHGAFAFGGGRVVFNGGAPLRGSEIGEFRAFINAQDVTLPLAQGVHATLDADLRAVWQPSSGELLEKKNLPRLMGNVVLSSFEYSRPVRMSANISDLAQRGRRTEFDSYQPEGDFVAFDLNVRSPRPLKLSNNLIDAQLSVEEGSLQLAGTNQRFGARGALRIEPGGRIHLRQNEFEIQQGQVRFDDPTRIAPLVDVTAVTDYRRYASGLEATPAAAATSASSSNSTSGQWRVTMHAHGDAETLRVDLSSQPELSQDDIFLLLTFGLTRAELDQAYLSQSQSASLGESVALEALGTLTGADKAVTEAIPVIDEFRFGSAYSSRAGRTEPTITIGKRLSERIRAFVTSGITESREVRSNVEVKINNKVSVQGSYDNVNDISSSSLGNLGADIRWRLDFE
jgi:translocation and assembly module TamB